MKISNLKLTKKILCLGATGLISLSTIGCNKQIIDLNKAYNVVIEQNNDNLSVVGISNYSDYDGTQVQFVTEDKLVVLSSTLQTQLINIDSQQKLNNYAESLVSDKNNIVYYDKLSDTEIDYSKEFLNKNYLDLQYEYNKAIILSDDVATIVELSSWTDYEDDKIQITLTDGTCILTSIDKIKLVSDFDASEDSLKNYALTLVGNEENVIFHKTKTNTK